MPHNSSSFVVLHFKTLLPTARRNARLGAEQRMNGPCIITRFFPFRCFFRFDYGRLVTGIWVRHKNGQGTKRSGQVVCLFSFRAWAINSPCVFHVQGVFRRVLREWETWQGSGKLHQAVTGLWAHGCFLFTSSLFRFHPVVLTTPLMIPNRLVLAFPLRNPPASE